MNLEIVCAGIGGRGVLLASTILIETAIDNGYNAIASDEYGMSQRGGSVVSLVKVGNFKSPLVGREMADIILAFEESEFYRNIAMLKREGIAVVNTRRKALPDAIHSLAKERRLACYLVDADSIAKERGMIQAANMALLGFFTFLSIEPYTQDKIEGTIRKKVPEKVLKKNLEIFQAGYAQAKNRSL